MIIKRKQEIKQQKNKAHKQRKRAQKAPRQGARRADAADYPARAKRWCGDFPAGHDPGHHRVRLFQHSRRAHVPCVRRRARAHRMRCEAVLVPPAVMRKHRAGRKRQDCRPSSLPTAFLESLHDWGTLVDFIPPTPSLEINLQTPSRFAR